MGGRLPRMIQERLEPSLGKSRIIENIGKTTSTYWVFGGLGLVWGVKS